MLQTQVCIVGGGPAGLVASMFLSKHAVEHVLLERLAKPVEKVCGECYDGRLTNVLNKLNPQMLEKMLQQQVVQHVKHYQYINTKGKTLHIDATKHKATLRLGTHRPTFDNFLLNEAKKSPYLNYYAGASVQNANIKNDKIYLSAHDLTIEADIAIVATGNQSPLAANLVQQKPEHFLLAARGYYKNLTAAFTDGFFQVYIVNKPVPCCLYLISLPNGLFTVELLILKKNVTHQYTPEILLHEVINNHPPVKKIFANAILVGKIKGSSLPLTTPSNRAISAERILLTGSASSSVNPLTGWGVGHAAFQGMCAAEQCIESLQQQNFSASFLQSYDKKIKTKLQQEWQKGRQADFIMNRLHHFTNGLLGVVAGNKYLSKMTEEILIKVG